ncbi:MAG: Membrane protein insertase YidC [Chlamydiia bacterium]|nr:Membrane protein insertase YidC [Chlamydiia bacterium]
MQQNDRRPFLIICLLMFIFMAFNNWMFPPKGSTSATEQVQKEVVIQETAAPLTFKKSTLSKKDSKPYVLKNDALQVVFSSQDGAVNEINLAIDGHQGNKSIINPIRFDKKVASDSPTNGYFPLETGYVKQGKKTETLDREMGGYTPFLRRSTDQKGNQVMAFHFVNDEGNPVEQEFVVSSFEADKIVFEGSVQGVPTRKSFEIASPYLIKLKVESERPLDEVYLSSGVPEVELISGGSQPKIQYLKQGPKKNKVTNVKLPKEGIEVEEGHEKWISTGNGFFGMIIQPLTGSNSSSFIVQKVSGEEAPTRLALIDKENQPYPEKNYPGYEVLVPASLGGSASEWTMFVGPYDKSILAQADKQLAVGAESGLGAQFILAQNSVGFFSFITEPFTKLLSMLLDLFHMITGSWGFSIILLTLALRIMLYPLNAWSIGSMMRMQDAAPEVEKIKNRYKDDKHKQHIETMKLYKEKKCNPLAGCFPLVIQMPFLFAMFDLLKTSFQLRGAPFIPGWIDNLTEPDVLFTWSTHIPFFGTQFHLLPFLLGGAMYLQTKLSKILNPQTTLSEQQQQMQSMGSITNLVFIFIFYNMPSGLNIYWLSSTLLGMAQQVWMNYRYKKKKANVSVIK